MELKGRVKATLAGLQRRAISAGYTREAAVLMPLFERRGQPHLLLTLRTEDVETHKGQVSFPGGMRHGDEDLETTALRETHEEIGLDHGRVEILGRFHDYVSSTDYRVTPFAGYVREPFDLVLQPAEVAEVLEVPFGAFFDPARFRVEKMTLRDRLIDVYFYSYGTYEIWGLTARIIRDFLAALK
jgi:8-oxo-dGTP pyrophosphatase MutT (NUDIX family)